jgi:hypothetical protein
MISIDAYAPDSDPRFEIDSKDSYPSTPKVLCVGLCSPHSGQGVVISSNVATCLERKTPSARSIGLPVRGPSQPVGSVAKTKLGHRCQRVHSEFSTKNNKETAESSPSVATKLLRCPAPDPATMARYTRSDRYRRRAETKARSPICFGTAACAVDRTAAHT